MSTHPNKDKSDSINYGRNINKFYASAQVARKLTYTWADVIEECFKKLDHDREHKPEEVNVVTSLMKEMEGHHFTMMRMLYILRQQEIQRLAFHYLPGHIQNIINQKALNCDDERQKQLEISETVHRFIPEIEHMVKVGETINEEFGKFLSKLTEEPHSTI
ncbi:hypothetical protein RF11_06353 [Thelohanellus kitauei]|uniref:Uncharacterized protein n=1 Tax=Thelohanellus kitauei TaxID=669202 RepID=A0A0C2MM64_THEKT|nr:hypothetical protein RF11_06353 [Thelohanellus kitauei]